MSGWEDRSADEFGEEIDEPGQSLLAPPLQLQCKGLALFDQTQSKVMITDMEVCLEFRLTLELPLRPGLEDTAEHLQLLGVDGQSLQT